MCQCQRVFAVSAAVLVVAVALSLLQHHAQRRSGEPFAFLRQHNATLAPADVHARNRMQEMAQARQGKSFYQWWNFIVFDAVTRDHFSIIYGVYTENGDKGRVSIGHLRGTELQARGTLALPLSRVELRRDYDMLFRAEGETEPSQTLTSGGDGVMLLTGKLPDIEWSLTVTRVNGYYGGLDGENPSQCFMASNLFGFHSLARGWIVSRGRRHEVNETARFRAYAAGSWGCELPGGEPAIEYPWTWFWLVVPRSDPAQDMGLCGGTARFATAVGPVYGGYSVAGLPRTVDASRHFSTRFVRLLHNTSLDFFLQASSSDSYYRDFRVQQFDWSTFRDAFGSAPVPLRQLFAFSSATYEFELDFRPTLAQYFRAPLSHNGKIFSVFRAVGATTRILVRRGGHVVFDETIDTMNAVEYAYVAPVDRLPDGL